ncbi:membrane protein of unknown function [Shewanella benthica]|uniref:Uncharacterized protein n=1 Tax=Shewanella benthica TaxID=43661 RepID=A0A330MAH1_9GAMM|nr:hypothetical protein [Shewanella benthica]SQH77990.1 membrane protein of unknown function [Shewanella benthica]
MHSNNVLIKRWQMPVSTWVSVYAQGGFPIRFLLPGFILADSRVISIQAVPLVIYAAIAASIIAPWAWIKGISAIGGTMTLLGVTLSQVKLGARSNNKLNLKPIAKSS